jgi:hypothetical protein
MWRMVSVLSAISIASSAKWFDSNHLVGADVHRAGYRRLQVLLVFVLRLLLLVSREEGNDLWQLASTSTACRIVLSRRN